MRLFFFLLLLAFPVSAAPRPNVVLIFIDDMGFGDVEFNGGTKAKTPHLNRMAEEGRRFHDFYVGCAVCSGSRTALLTGCHYQRLSMAAVLFPQSDKGLHPDEVTLAEMLKETGYRTACVGKWHLGHLPPCLPTYQGFESYYGIPYSNDMWIDPANQLAKDLKAREGLTRAEVEGGHKKKNWVPLMRGEEVIEYPADQSTLTKRYTEEAIRFIKERGKDEPFFLYLPHTMVHLPLAVSEKFNNPQKALIHNAIEEVDWSVGEILETLRSTGLAENTLVIFTSDNGAAVGSSLPLRAKKGSVYDGGIREPTLMWWPGTIPAGTVCTEVTASIDLMPTLAALSGGKLPERKIDGKDIRPLILGKEGAKSPHETWVLMHGPGTVRSGKWKFYPWREGQGGRRKPKNQPKPDPSAPPVQLYDTVADIGETTNVAEKHPELVQRLQAVYDAHVAEIQTNRRPTAEMKRPAGVDPIAARESRHLFILSGQSNMVGMDPAVSFIPAVTKAFGEERVLVVKDAHGGQSIRSWCKSNHEFPPPTTGRVPKVRGELYGRLISKVKTAIEGQALQTVTFIWMQGESDLNNTAYDAYLEELLAQLQADLGFEKINVVIGRISDSGLDREKRLAGRLRIRRIQQEFAEAHPRGAWVDTDDLNDRREGDKVVNDLHYTKEGYRILGQRLAEKAIGLVKKSPEREE